VQLELWSETSADVAFELQYTLSNNMRVDCVLRLPPPTGMVPVDSKFPLENYHRMFDRDIDQAERAAAQKQFKADVRKHVDDIARKYIIAGETSDGAVMFIPRRRCSRKSMRTTRVVEYANGKRVWIVSPHADGGAQHGACGAEGCRDAQAHPRHQGGARKLGADFARFDERMKSSPTTSARRTKTPRKFRPRAARSRSASCRSSRPRSRRNHRERRAAGPGKGLNPSILTKGTES